MEETGHDVYRSCDDIHRAICERVLDSPLPPPPSADYCGEAPVAEAAAAGVPPPTSTAALPPMGSCNGEHSAKGDGAAECGGGRARGRCLALRDFYPFWRRKLEDAAAGKVLAVDLCQDPEVMLT